MDLKLTVLRKILEFKDILFGSFSPSITKQSKREKWQEITNFCHSIGVVSAAKEYTYVRDAYWPNIKRTTMAKIDNAKKTGSAGGANKKLTQVDELVLEILGKDSPTVAGLHVVDTMSENVEIRTEEEPGTSANAGNSLISDAEAPEVSRVQNKTNKRKTIVMEGSQRHTELLEINNLKKRKLEAELENIKLQNYKLQLEIYEKEKNLNVKLQNTESVVVFEETISDNLSEN